MSVPRTRSAMPGEALVASPCVVSLSVMGDRFAGVTDTSRPRLLLIDGHSMAYRAFFALPVDKFSTTSGQHTNAVHGFISMIATLLRVEEPTHVAVAF